MYKSEEEAQNVFWLLDNDSINQNIKYLSWLYTYTKFNTWITIISKQKNKIICFELCKYKWNFYPLEVSFKDDGN